MNELKKQNDFLRRGILSIRDKAIFEDDKKLRDFCEYLLLPEFGDVEMLTVLET